MNGVTSSRVNFVIEFKVGSENYFNQDIVFALIWALFIGLRINRVETRDGKRKLVNY